MVKITFSWDDGAPEDFRMAELSAKYGMPAMFFIPEKNPERNVLKPAEVRQLFDAGFELGAHTQSHLYLTKIPRENIFPELVNGQTYLQEITGQSVPHFCLPGGFFDSEIMDLSRKVFQTVRTAETGAVHNSTQNPWLIRPTFHFYNRGIKSLLFNALKHDLFLFQYILKHYKADYFDILKGFVEHAHKQEKLFHIQFWGHSWELEEFGLWGKLEELFLFLKNNYPDTLCSYDQFVKKQS